MAAKKKALSGEEVLAVVNIAIDGKHFEAGKPVTGVDPDQLALALRAKRVITAADLALRNAAIAARDAEVAEPDEDEDEDEGEGNEALSTGEPD